MLWKNVWKAKDIIIEGKKDRIYEVAEKSVTAQIHNISVRYLKNIPEFLRWSTGNLQGWQEKKMKQVEFIKTTENSL